MAQLCRALASVHLWTTKEALMMSSDDITSPAPVMTQLSTEDAGMCMGLEGGRGTGYGCDGMTIGPPPHSPWLCRGS